MLQLHLIMIPVMLDIKKLRAHLHNAGFIFIPSISPKKKDISYMKKRECFM